MITSMVNPDSGGAIIVIFGELTRLNAGGFPVTGSAISVDDSGGQFSIVGGYLVAAQNNITLGTYNLTTDTDEEIQISLGMNPSTVRPRRRELVLLGRVMHDGRFKSTMSGRRARIWVVMDANGGSGDER